MLCMQTYSHPIRTAIDHLQLLFPLGLSMLASVPAAGQAVQIVAFLKQYPPVGIVEGTPGVFYFATDASPSFAFSVTPQQGSKTALGKVNSSFLGPLVSGANNRLYSATQYGPNPANVVSLGPTGRLQASRTAPLPASPM
jgi:hypothetical protein